MQLLNLFNPTGTRPPVVTLSSEEVAQFIALLDKIEKENLWNLPLHFAVGDYMLSNGITHAQLMARYQAVCPEYRKNKFPLEDGLNYAGELIDQCREEILAQTYANMLNGTLFDPHTLIEKAFKNYMAAAFL